jgi:Ca2+/Na+ antiporter
MNEQEQAERMNERRSPRPSPDEKEAEAVLKIGDKVRALVAHPEWPQPLRKGDEGKIFQLFAGNFMVQFGEAIGVLLPTEIELAQEPVKEVSLTPWPDYVVKDEEDSSFFLDPLVVFWEWTLPEPEKCWRLFAVSILYIGLCTYVMVDAASRIGIILKIPSLVMGLIPLAAGTSIPDALGSIAVAQQGEGDMAVCNALGSNVFDILLGLGVPWLIRTIQKGEPVKFADGTFGDLLVDVIFLVFFLGLFLGALAMNKWELNRRTGIMLMTCYGMYVLFTLILVAAGVKKDRE